MLFLFCMVSLISLDCHVLILFSHTYKAEGYKSMLHVKYSGYLFMSKINAELTDFKASRSHVPQVLPTFFNSRTKFRSLQRAILSIYRVPDEVNGV